MFKWNMKSRIIQNTWRKHIVISNFYKISDFLSISIRLKEK